MTEWQGPWRCEKCGLDYPNATSNLTAGKCQIHCGGTPKPYDRRRAAPDPSRELIRELRDALAEEHDNWIAMTGGKHRKATACSTCGLIARATAHLDAEAGKPVAEAEAREKEGA